MNSIQRNHKYNLNTGLTFTTSRNLRKSKSKKIEIEVHLFALYGDNKISVKTLKSLRKMIKEI